MHVTVKMWVNMKLPRKRKCSRNSQVRFPIFIYSLQFIFFTFDALSCCIMKLELHANALYTSLLVICLIYAFGFAL